ncbi:MAG: hypothetical protein HY868_06300 [Chloroflexi bacterium]|nr:hypothetical protein [Chloroflexota bacterium]
MTPETVYNLWWISLVILLVVTGVVAALLTMILRTARTIDHVAGDIWTTGKLVANNTVHIPLLIETNRHAGAILETAKQIVAGAHAIEQHAAGCPGCPACVLSR